MLLDQKTLKVNHMRRSSIWKTSHFELHRKSLRISHLNVKAWLLNQQDNNNNDSHICKLC